MRNEQYEKACEILWEKKQISVYLHDGELVSGSLFDIVSVDDDPEGLGYFAIQRPDGGVVAVSPRTFGKIA